MHKRLPMQRAVERSKSNKNEQKASGRGFVDDKEIDGEVELVNPCLLDVINMYDKNS